MKFRVACLAPLILALGSNPSGASYITYTASGSGTGGALAATADFTTSSGQIQVHLINTLAADIIRSSAQALSDVSFTLSNAPGTLGATTASGQFGNVSANGLVTYGSGDPTRWLGAGGQGGFSIVGNTVTLETVGGGQPTQMMTPFIANGGTFSNLNQGFANSNPYVIGPATFTLNLSGVTADTRVTAVTFSFGTRPDSFLPGTVVPEPGSVQLMAIGLATLAGGVWMRRVARVGALGAARPREGDPRG